VAPTEQTGMPPADFTRAPAVTIAVKASIHDAFEYHRWDAEQEARGNKVRAALQAACEVIVENVPPSPDRSAAIRKLREARMDCNSAITHRGRY